MPTHTTYNLRSFINSVMIAISYTCCRRGRLCLSSACLLRSLHSFSFCRDVTEITCCKLIVEKAPHTYVGPCFSTCCGTGWSVVNSIAAFCLSSLDRVTLEGSYNKHSRSTNLYTPILVRRAKRNPDYKSIYRFKLHKFYNQSYSDQG